MSFAQATFREVSVETKCRIRFLVCLQSSIRHNCVNLGLSSLFQTQLDVRFSELCQALNATGALKPSLEGTTAKRPDPVFAGISAAHLQIAWPGRKLGDQQNRPDRHH
jgi:hypothetical protein